MSVKLFAKRCKKGIEFINEFVLLLCLIGVVVMSCIQNEQLFLLRQCVIYCELSGRSDTGIEFCARTMNGHGNSLRRQGRIVITQNVKRYSFMASIKLLNAMCAAMGCKS